MSIVLLIAGFGLGVAGIAVGAYAAYYFTRRSSEFGWRLSAQTPPTLPTLPDLIQPFPQRPSLIPRDALRENERQPRPGVQVLTLNALQEVRLRTIYEVADVCRIAKAIINVPDCEEHLRLSYWQKATYDLLVGVILHVLYAEVDKTLRGVALYLTDPGFSNEDQIFETMANSDHDYTSSDSQLRASGWLNLEGNPSRTHPVVAEAAKVVLQQSRLEKSIILLDAKSAMLATLLNVGEFIASPVGVPS